MSRLILIRGPICAGKSTTAKSLLDEIKNCSLVDQDIIKRAIDKNMQSDWRDRIAFDTTIYLSNLLMKERRNIIADVHSSIPRQYEDYRQLAGKNNYLMLSFLIYPPLEVCQQRNRAREIPDINYKITDEDVKKYWDNPYFVENEIVLDSPILSTREIIEKILERAGTSSEKFIHIMKKIMSACEKDKSLLTGVPGLYSIFRDEKRAYTAENLSILSANHLFDDFPSAFGITQQEGWFVRGYMQTGAKRDDYEFVRELHEAFPDMLNPEREEFVEEIRERRAKKRPAELILK